MQNLYLQVEGVCLVITRIHFFEQPLLIQIATIISSVAVLLIIGTLLVIYINRTNFLLHQKQTQMARIAIQAELNDHLLQYDSIKEISEMELNDTITRLGLLKDHSRVFRQTLVDTLIYFKRNLSGNITTNIKTAYDRLDLKESALQRLSSRSWFERVKGLIEVQEINDNKSLVSVRELKQDKNIEVRIEAYSTLIKLDKNSPFSFLNTEQAFLSEWHQILLFEAITKSEIEELPDFKNYLTVSNPSVILFCIKLVYHYKQFNAIDNLISLLGHPDAEVRNRSVYTLAALNAIEAESRMKEIYPKEHNKNKAQILISLGKMASGNSINFLADKFAKADHYSLLYAAGSAIAAHPEEIKTQALQRIKSLDDEQLAVLKHFEDPLIKSNGIY